MKSKVNELNKKILILLAGVCMLLGLSFNSLQAQAAESTQEVAVTGVQLRGDQATRQYFLVINTNEHAEVTTETAVSNTEKYAKLLSQITLYRAKNDTVGISAAEICETSGWIMNKWMSGGLMIPMEPSTYESFNGSSVYGIKIEKGAVLPCGDKDLVVMETVHYINLEFDILENKFGAFAWAKQKEDIIYDMEFTGVQMRADVNLEMYFLVLQASDYASVTPATKVANVKAYTDLLSKITLYTSPEDTTGIKASELCETDNWEMNTWGSEGLMIRMKASAYEKYNGTTVYKMIIEKDAIVPCETHDLKVQERTVYVNSGYGKEETRNSAFWWSFVPDTLKNHGTCSLSDMNNRADDSADTRWLFLFFAENFEATTDVSGWIEQLNILDYIEFYDTEDLDKDPIPLRDVYTGVVTIKQFSQSNAMTLTIDDKYSGANMYVLNVKDGCQIPFIINGEYGYKVVEGGKTFINARWGETGDIFGVYDEKGNARTYENWGVWWTAVRKVSFTVKGIEDKTFPTRILAVGDAIEADEFAVDGYDLEITTADGERCMGGYIVRDKNDELILTYTKSTATSETKGIEPIFLVAGIAGVLVITGVIVTVVMNKKKKVTKV